MVVLLVIMIGQLMDLLFVWRYSPLFDFGNFWSWSFSCGRQSVDQFV
jgi:hypothetical protein